MGVRARRLDCLVVVVCFFVKLGSEVSQAGENSAEGGAESEANGGEKNAFFHSMSFLSERSL